MKNRIIITIIILFSICIISICIIGVVFMLLSKNKDKAHEISNNQIINNIMNVTNIESEDKLVSSIKVIINGKTYNAKIDESKTGQSFTNMLPVEYNMSDLNKNEKYVYLRNTLPTNAYNPKHIEAGDIMLFGNNCLVVFYKSFDTSYSYTKIGHIENIGDLGNKDITIRFEK